MSTPAIHAISITKHPYEHSLDGHYGHHQYNQKALGLVTPHNMAMYALGNGQVNSSQLLLGAKLLSTLSH